MTEKSDEPSIELALQEKKFDFSEAAQKLREELLPSSLSVVIHRRAGAFWLPDEKGPEIYQGKVSSERETLQDAIREGVSLRDADLRKMDLCGMNFSGVDFAAVDFSDADLRNVNFAGAYLYAVRWDRAEVEGANFSEATLDVGILSADFGEAKSSFYGILEHLTERELSKLERLVTDGYRDISSLTATIASAKGCTVDTPGIEALMQKALTSRAKHLFFAIEPGDTPETNFISLLIRRWIQEHCRASPNKSDKP